MDSRDPRFFDELKQINEQFFDVIKRSNEKTLFNDFSPVCNDYISLLKDLYLQYPEPEKPNEIASQNQFSFMKSGFSFANSFANVSQNNISSNNTFSFFNPSAFGSSAPLNNVTSSATAAEEEDEVHVPPESNVDKYNEPDAGFSVRCKLYIKTELDSTLDLLGVGSFFVKDLESDKQQIIVRQDPDLRRVLLNEYITPNIPIQRRPKAVQLVFPHVVEGKQSNCLYIARVKDEKEADALFDFLKGSKKK